MTFPILFQAEAIEEFLDYTALDLLSAFGGFIGMFIGANVLSLFDIAIAYFLKFIARVSKTEVS